MKSLLLIIAVMMAGCGHIDSAKIPSKPFIVLEKTFGADHLWHYTYVGSNGGQRFFEEKTDRYSIGDTIK